jgi:hypothetical protein
MPFLPAVLLGLAATSQAPPPVRLIREFTIDASSGVHFGTIVGLDLGPDGSIAAMDESNGVIYRFTPAGRLRDSLGRKGQGPGEFLASAGLAVGPGGEVALADIRTRRLTIWNADGTLRGSSPVRAGMPIALLWRESTPILGILSFGPGVPSQVSFAPAGLGEQTRSAAAIATFPDPVKADFPTAISCGMCRRTLSPDGRLVVSAPDTIYRISQLDPEGKAILTWSRPGVGAGLRTEEEVALLEKRLAAGPGGGRPNPEGRPRPVVPRGDIRFRPRVQGMGFDARGRLLALVSNAGSRSPVLDVFSGDGKFLGTISPAEHLTTLVVRGNRAIGLGETPDGEHQIHVYRIE